MNWNRFYKCILMFFSLAADVVLFNSKFNMETFLGNIKSFFKTQPDFRPKNLREQIEPKCFVLYFPMNFEDIPKAPMLCPTMDSPVKIVWPHRWLDF